MAAEILGLVTGFDQSHHTQNLLEEILGKEIPIHVFIDFRTTFNVLAKSGGSIEKILQIDAAALRESLRAGRIRQIGFIEGKNNRLTILPILDEQNPLLQLLRTNRSNPTSVGWLEIS